MGVYRKRIVLKVEGKPDEVKSFLERVDSAYFGKIPYDTDSRKLGDGKTGAIVHIYAQNHAEFTGRYNMVNELVMNQPVKVKSITEEKIKN